MTGATAARPTCVYASGGLRRNSTKLIVVMCIGLALAIYGLYIQSRSHANPHYQPSMAVATNWFYHNIGQHIVHPSHLLNGCKGRASHAFKPSVRQVFTYRLVHPITRYSGLMNGLVNLAQIVVLKICCKSLRGADAIAGLSILGLAISMVCLVGSFATCKLMCVSCLGIHHLVIIYLAMRRRKILQTIQCPTTGTPAGQAACTFGAKPSGGSGPSSSSSTAAHDAKGPNSGRHTSSCVTRRGNSSDQHDPSRRRSTRF